jgi:FMN phosphatase YigB (HAD superfamily)
VIRAVLLDLDGTLLENEMDAFLPPYLSRLSAELADIAAPDEMVAELMQGTQLMRENMDPTRSLEEVFASHFYPQLDTSADALKDRLEDFYAQQFPTFSDLTKRRPEAKDVMKRLFHEGYQVAIATDPLFPRAAVDHRLEWAGVSVSEFPYAIITSYETFRFSKPHLSYYTQILGMLGRSPSEAVMVGDDLEADLLPARSLGMPVYFVGEEHPADIPGGALDGMLPWLASSAASQADPEVENSPHSLIHRLRGNLAAVLAMTADLDTNTWRRAPGEGEWAPLEILCHLRDLEIEVNQPRFRRVLEEQEPFIPHADTDHLAEERDYVSQTPHLCQGSFSEARRATIDMLSGIDTADWERLGRHSLFGPTSLQELVRVVVDHDLIHLDQLRRALPGATTA